MIRITEFASLHETGRRGNQEDYLCPAAPAPDERIFVVCDGMGGHGHGEVASKIIATTVYESLKALNASEYTPEMLQSAVDTAIDRLAAEAAGIDDEKVPGTTLVVLAVNPMNLLVGHIGDSRAYLMSADGLKRFRTRDHSLVQDAIDSEILTEEQAFTSPKKNVVTRAIMADGKHVVLDVDRLEPLDGEKLLICTDGVNDAMRDNVIESYMVSRDVAGTIDLLKQECEINSRDNYTAMLMRFSQDEAYPKPVDDSKPKPVDRNQFQRQNTEEETTGGEQRRCPLCGAAIPAEAQFCPYDGYPLSESADLRDSSAPHGHSFGNEFISFVRNNKWLVIAGAAACVSAGIFSMCHSGTPDPTIVTPHTVPDQPNDSHLGDDTQATAYDTTESTINQINQPDSMSGTIL